VVTRAGNGVREVLVVRRERYDDWSLPKGKSDPEELPPVTAVREVAEETGARVRLGPPLDSSRYSVGERAKLVYYWSAEALEVGTPSDTDEVAEVAWWPLAEARTRLSYASDVTLIEQQLEQPTTVAVLLLRHGKALARKDWPGSDVLRPLEPAGRAQAQALTGLLGAYGVQRLASSTAARCASTLAPYAAQVGLEVAQHAELSELATESETSERMELLLRQAITNRTPMAICSHRPTLPLLLEIAGVAPHTLRPADCVVAHIGATGECYAVEWFPQSH